MSKITRADVLTNPRWAGEVERYHTWPVHRRQSVGAHTWQVMRIYWQIWGPMSAPISTHLLWHDAGELKAGDLPFPVKANDQVLKAAIDGIEDQALFEMAGKGARPYLTKQETMQVKVCDLIEMWEFGMVELLFGNQLAQPIVDDIMRAIGEKLSEMPETDQVLVSRYINKPRLSKCA